MDLYSRRIVGWALDKRMTKDLVNRAMCMAIVLRCPPRGLMFHSDRGSRYTSEDFQRLLKEYGITASMSGVGACRDNAVMERFCGSLKSEWLSNVRHLPRTSMREDIQAYMRYYNHQRLHTSNGNQTPIAFERGEYLQNKVSAIV